MANKSGSERRDMSSEHYYILIDTQVSLAKSHTYYVSELPPHFESLAESDPCATETIRHKEKPF
jgi:GMP synthase-like glutamine amidotransferase